MKPVCLSSVLAATSLLIFLLVNLSVERQILGVALECPDKLYMISVGGCKRTVVKKQNTKVNTKLS